MLHSFHFEFQRMKALADKALAQTSDDSFFKHLPDGGNSIATLVKHVAGNQKSRFTDFLTSDGEKPNRNRDSEFDADTDNRETLMQSWEAGWKLLLDLTSDLQETDLSKTIYIRNEGLSVEQALFRQVSHFSYHIGQIVLMAKLWKGEAWNTLSIPKGDSNKHQTNGFYLRP